MGWQFNSPYIYCLKGYPYSKMSTWQLCYRQASNVGMPSLHFCDNFIFGMLFSLLFSCSTSYVASYVSGEHLLTKCLAYSQLSCLGQPTVLTQPRRLSQPQLPATVEPPNIQDTLGPAILSSVETLSSSRRLKLNYCYGKGVQVCPLLGGCPCLRGSLIGGSTVVVVKEENCHPQSNHFYLMVQFFIGNCRIQKLASLEQCSIHWYQS